MSYANQSSALSDDDRTKAQARQTDQEEALSDNRQVQQRAQRHLGEQEGFSVTGEVSVQEVNIRINQAGNDSQAPISEQPEDEADHASVGAGTINYQHHDVMSENVQMQHLKFDKDPMESIKVMNSDNTKVSAVAAVSPIVKMPDPSSMIAEFEKKIEHFYSEFADQLKDEYLVMRNSYMTDFQGNLDHNTSRKDERITEVQGEIEQAEEQLQANAEMKAKSMAMLVKCFKKRKQEIVEAKFYHLWRNEFMERRFIANKARYSQMKLKERKMRKVFESWRHVAHHWFKEKIDGDSFRFRNNLKKQFYKEWDTKVQGQLRLISELELQIKEQVEARQALAQSYETNMNSGMARFNQQTDALREDDPLVKEIQLIVAQQLMQRGATNQSINDLIRTGSRDLNLLDRVFSSSSGRNQAEMNLQENAAQNLQSAPMMQEDQKNKKNKDKKKSNKKSRSSSAHSSQGSSSDQDSDKK